MPVYSRAFPSSRVTVKLQDYLVVCGSNFSPQPHVGLIYFLFFSGPNTKYTELTELKVYLEHRCNAVQYCWARLIPGT